MAAKRQLGSRHTSPLLRARSRTTLAGSLKPEPTESTPRVVTSADFASAPISAAFPLITVGCQCARSSIISAPQSETHLWKPRADGP
jgi:hypothetical protein